MTERSHMAQHGEDELLATHFNSKRGGVFIEIGAFDGRTLSNTWFFEHTLGWTGVLIEANPDRAMDCARSRPRSQVFAVAVVAPQEAGPRINFDVVDGCEELSSRVLQGRYKNLISSVNRREAETLLTVRQISVPTATVDEILESAAVSEIDFVTIDIEGHELAALHGMALGSRWRPGVVLIESTTRFPDPRLTLLMFRAGYGYRRTIVINDWYEPTTPLRRLAGAAHQYSRIAPRSVRWCVRRLHRLHGKA